MKNLHFLILFQFLYLSISAQYKLKISDLNSRFDYQLKQGQKIYYQTKNATKVNTANVESVNSSSIKLGMNSVTIDSISWISIHKYRDNNFRIWARNTVPNLHLTKTPSYDLETSHLAEIVLDTTTFNVDSNAFATPKNMQLLKLFFPQLAYNLKHQALSPFRASAQQWTVSAVAAASFYGLLKADSIINTKFSEATKTNGSLLNLNRNISQLGSRVGLGFVTCWLAGGLIFKNEKNTETALLATQAVITSTIWNRLLKYSTLRERPYSATNNNRGACNFRGPKEISKYWDNSDYHSLGSGHTATAFAIATVFAEQYKETPFVAIASYTAASAVAVSRVITNKHWASDVFIGALIGYTCAKQITSFKKTYYKNKSSKFGINTTLANVFINNNQYPVISITAFVK